MGKNRENREQEWEIGKKGKKEEKSGRKGKNWEDSYSLPLMTDRASYTTGSGVARASVSMRV